MYNNKVFVDTNIIIEAVRVNAWSALSSSYMVETVQKCKEEALTGQNPVQKKIFDSLFSHKPSKLDILNLSSILINHDIIIDDGELHLFSFLYSNHNLKNDIILVSTADRAAVKAACVLGWVDSLISLEEMMVESGVTRTQINQLKVHFSRRWLINIKSEYRLDNL